jgi:hypothetical protein
VSNTHTSEEKIKFVFLTKIQKYTEDGKYSRSSCQSCLLSGRRGAVNSIRPLSKENTRNIHDGFKMFPKLLYFWNIQISPIILTTFPSK